MELLCKSCVTTFPELNTLVSQLKCGICYDFVRTPMITTCGHSYCSICIRTWIMTKQLCPTCQSEVRGESLRKNIALENCIDPYTSLQIKLHELCQSGAFKNFKVHAKSSHSTEHSELMLREESNQNESKQTIVVKQSSQTPISPEPNKGAERHYNEPQNVNSPAKIPGLFFQTPQVNRQKTETITSPTSNSSSTRAQNDSASSSIQSNNLTRVPCPVCSVDIPERNINAHLDKCLAMQESTPAMSPKTPEIQRREPLKKLVYHLMADKEIKKVLTNFCLSTKGDRSQLINRLQRYTVLYNSECDSLNPRPVADIRKQLERDEEALTKVAPTTAKVFRVSRTADPAEIEEINKQYRHENKSAFDDLIQQIRQRNKKKELGGLPVGSTTVNRTSVACSETSGDHDGIDIGIIAANFPNRNRTSDKNDEIVSSAVISSKRNRSSDSENDDGLNVKRIAKTPKSRRIKDSDEELLTPKSAENSPDTSAQIVSTNHKHSNEVLRRILPKPRKVSNSSTYDDNEILNDSPSSPVLSRTCPNGVVKITNKRPQRRKVAQREPKKVPSEEVRRPIRRKARETPAISDEEMRSSLQRNRAKTRVQRVRTVSRTPSLSPSRLENLNGTSRDSSETPEKKFEMRKRPFRDNNSDTDDGNDNLSQLVSLMDESRDSSEDTQEC